MIDAENFRKQWNKIRTTTGLCAIYIIHNAGTIYADDYTLEGDLILFYRHYLRTASTKLKYIEKVE